MDAWLTHPRIKSQPGYPCLEGRNFVKFNSDLRAFWESQHKKARKRAKDAEKQRKSRAERKKRAEAGEDVCLMELFVKRVRELSDIEKQMEMLEKRRKELIGNENGCTE
jgi:hypothetical protein